MRIRLKLELKESIRAVRPDNSRRAVRDASVVSIAMVERDSDVLR
jgi:hypothetical protein